ncbi:MAG TPA: hypothetical protein VF453_17900 [Burkholderiaceae bacterium]
MTRIDRQQFAALGAAQHERFRQRLVSFIDGQFGPPPPGAQYRSSAEVADSALEFAQTVGAMTEAQVARIAILLVGVNRRQSPPDEVARVRAALLHPDKTPDERIEAAAAVLGITG